MTSNHVEQITVTVTLASGDVHMLTEHRPDPVGGNPAFMSQQVERGMDNLSNRLQGVVALHCKQIPRERA